MSAAHAFDSAPAAKPAKSEPKHAAVKSSRFHLPNRTSFEYVGAGVRSVASPSGREARRLQRAVEADTEIRTAAKNAKAANAADAKATKAAEQRARNAAAIAAPLPRSTFTVRDGFAVDTKGESTEVTHKVVAGIASAVETAGETVGSVYNTHWLAQLFETPEQARNRVNGQAVAQTLLLVASLVGRFAARRK